jgi:serine/threonine-protein kinase
MRGMDSRRSLGTRYRIRAKLGDGGTGTVFKATDLLLDMPVAVKVLHPKLARVKEAVDTLRHEARITMQLSHRHIVRLHNLEKAGATYFLVMEYVEGSTLREILAKSGPLPPRDAATAVEVCAEALNYAHRHGVLHNDLKPDNLMINKDGLIKVIDFGIACLINRQWNDQFIMGTPVYMSPEQARGEELDHRTDIYALGAISYELLVGAPPLAAGVTVEQVAKMRKIDIEGVPDPLSGVIAKAVAADRRERFHSVTDFAADYRSVVDSLWPSGSTAPG